MFITPYIIRSGIDRLIPPARRFARNLEVMYLRKEVLERINEIYPEERSVMNDAANGSTAIRDASKGRTQ
jgi:hypothetical protein